MESFVEIVGIAGLFILRVGVPLLIIALLTWSLRRLDAKWQAEAEQARLHALDAALPLLADSAVDGRPCWEQRGCSAERREYCAAYQNPALPCWQTRTEIEGAQPAGCVDCGIYHAGVAQHARVTVTTQT